MRATLPALVLLLAPLAAPQVLLSYDGDFKGGQFGAAVAVIGPQNDGAPGLLVGCPDDDTNGLDSGAAYVLSGADGHVIRTYHDTQAGDRFGAAVVALGDINGDTRVDYAIGAPLADTTGADAGRVFVYSGQDGSSLGSIESPAAGIHFGAALATLGYVPVPIFISQIGLAIGAPYADGPAGTDCGAFYVRYWDGTVPPFTPAIQFGLQAGEHYGAALAGTLGSLAVGAPDFDLGSTARVGRFEAWDRLDPTQTGQPLLQQLWAIGGGTVAGGALGTSVAVVRWKNGLAGAQFAAGAPFAATPYVTVQRDVNGVPQELAHLTGTGQFGAAITSGVHDEAGASFGYVAVGSPTQDTSVTAGGRVRVWIEGGLKQLLSGSHISGRYGAALGSELGLEYGSHSDWMVIGAPDSDVAGIDDGLIDSFSASGGQGGLVHQFSESQPPGDGDQAGRSVAGVGDVDGDGVPDQLVGSPTDDEVLLFPLPVEIPNCGSARLLSGATGASLGAHFGSADGDELGWSVAAAGDVDLDGVPDFLVGAPQRHNASDTMGYARLYSGANGGVLHSFSGAVADDEFGFAVGGGSDLNGDGRRDLLVGAPGTSKGTVYCYSGANYFLLGGVNGANANDRFGAAVAGLGDDVNADGKQDWIAGAPNYDVAGNQQGRAYLVTSTLSLTAFWTVTGSLQLEHTGAAVAPAGDMNGDGVTDVLVGAPINKASGVGAGKLRVISGSSSFGKQFAAVDGDAQGDEFGSGVALLGDVNGDGVPDWAAGAPQPVGALNADGYLKIVAGKTFALLQTVTGQLAEGLGASVAGAGDVDGDGIADVLAGAPTFDGDGKDSGEARVFSLAAAGSPWTDLGFALPGASGAPSLVGSGTLVAGSPGALTLSNAAHSALAYLFIALSATPTPFKGGHLLPVPPVLTAIVVTSPAGDLPLPWTAWPSGLSGLDLYFQYAIQDASAIQGVALSNALRAAVP